MVAQVALALVLLTGAGLLLSTLYRLQAVPIGFDPGGVLAMDISFDEKEYPAGERRATFIRQIIQQLESLPGVEAAGAATTLPMGNFTDAAVRAENQPERDESYIATDYDFIAGNFFAALRVPLLNGRFFSVADDTGGAPRTAILSAALARRVFPESEPLGQTVRLWGQPWRVVGVVGDVRQRGLDREMKEHIYLPQVFNPYPCSLVVRTHGSPWALAHACQREILELDPNQPVANFRTLEQLISGGVAQRRVVFLVLALFAGTALALAGVGLCGLLSYSVAQRTREIGIRVALGANAGHLQARILAHGFRLTLLGISVGLVGAFACTRLLRGLLFGVEPTDPGIMAAVAVILLLVAALACWLPARRATKVDPMIALRAE